MIRLHVICEGQTEEAFVKELLIPRFRQKGIELIPGLIGKPGHKGGNVNIQRLEKDVRIRLLTERTAFVTTFFDFYGLSMDFPGKAEAARCVSVQDKAACVQSAMVRELGKSLDENALWRFIPYVQMYEFEALLFSHPAALAKGLDRPDLESALQRIRDAFDSPEQINDSPVTAPSKRILRLIPGYQKPLNGVIAALEIGLLTIRQECEHFSAWLTRLESFAEGNN